MKAAQDKKKFIVIMIIAVAVLAVSVFFFVQSGNVSKKNKELEERRSRLEQLLEEEGIRKEELADEEAYVQTRKYIEEKAKSIGYVYPDEIIFREDE